MVKKLTLVLGKKVVSIFLKIRPATHLPLIHPHIKFQQFRPIILGVMASLNLWISRILVLYKFSETQKLIAAACWHRKSLVITRGWIRKSKWRRRPHMYGWRPSATHPILTRIEAFESQKSTRENKLQRKCMERYSIFKTFIWRKLLFVCICLSYFHPNFTYINTTCSCIIDGNINFIFFISIFCFLPKNACFSIEKNLDSN